MAAVYGLVVGTLVETATGAVAADDYDIQLDSQETFWTGQGLYFNGSEILPNVATHRVPTGRFRFAG